MEETLQSRRRSSLKAPDFSLRQLFAFAQLVRHAQLQRRQLSNLHEQLAPLLGAAALHLHIETVRRRTLLVADDQPTVRAITRGVLESLGHSVFECDSDFSRVPRMRLDAVLLDVPIWSEEQLMRIRKARHFSARIIVATPLPEGLARAWLRAAGASAFIDKPLHPLTLERTIREVIR